MKNTAKNRPIFGLTFCCTVKYICETKKLHKCILAALVEAPEKQTFSLYVDVYRVEAIWTEKYGVAKMSDT